jgi:hypothetical protein
MLLGCRMDNCLLAVLAVCASLRKPSQPGVNMPESSYAAMSQIRFERTRAGQQDMLTAQTVLSPAERRLLALVNGHTPLRDLLALLGETEVPQASVMTLLNSGLIRRSETKPKPVARLGRGTRGQTIEWFNAH